MKALSSVFIIVIAALTLAACTHTPEPTPEPAAAQEESATQPAGSETIVDDADTTPTTGVTKISASNFAYDVKEIRVKAGESLTVAVTNDEGFHDFMIDELEVNSGMIPAGETKELVIPTDKPGTYEYYCSVGEHRKMGMKGMLIIE